MQSTQKVGDFSITAWSIAGNETSVAVVVGDMSFCFDIGFSPRPMIFCDHVFISHGHIDHIGAIAQHIRKRHLNHLSAAKYYMHSSFVEKVRLICKTFHELHGHGSESLLEPDLVAFDQESSLQLSKDWKVEAFKTNHTCNSQGYVLFRLGQDGQYIPEIAYLGDTEFSVFTPPAHPQLLSVRLLITEATFLDNPKHLLKNAAKHRHTHIEEIRKSAHLFKDIGNILLIHPSDRYSPSDIFCLPRSHMPQWLSQKIITSSWAKICQNL